MPTKRANGCDVYYEEAGLGPGLLFIHGGASGAASWADQVQRLSSRYRCVAYDRRGNRRSSFGDARNGGVEQDADDAAALINALQMAPCIGVGSSRGANVVVDLARRYPHLLAGAVLSDPPLFGLDPAAARDFWVGLQEQLAAAAAAGGGRATVDAFMKTVIPQSWAAMDDDAREPFLANCGGLRRDLHGPPYAIGRQDLRALRLPCLVVTGRLGLPLFGLIARMVAGTWPGAQLLELDSDHATYLMQPDSFAGAIDVFAQTLGSDWRAARPQKV